MSGYRDYIVHASIGASDLGALVFRLNEPVYIHSTLPYVIYGGRYFTVVSAKEKNAIFLAVKLLESIFIIIAKMSRL